MNRLIVPSERRAPAKHFQIALPAECKQSRGLGDRGRESEPVVLGAGLVGLAGQDRVKSSVWFLLKMSGGVQVVALDGEIFCQS